MARGGVINQPRTELVGPSLAGIFFLSASITFGQETSPAPPTSDRSGVTIEEVIVTGSNIPTSEEVGPNPVLTLNRELIDRSGQGTTTEQFLKSQPVMNASGIPVSNNADASGGPRGTTSVSLRGFDPGATLVLIDGRRITPFPGNANSGARFIDLFTVPITAVQSIEILKDGASTTYGADAVAGVINLKFYKDYRGAQLTLYYGDTLDKDAGLYSGDILFGTGDDKVSVVGDIFFYHHNSMFQRDRGNTLKGKFFNPNASPYNLELTRAAVLPALGLPPDKIPNLNPQDNPGFFTLDANDNPVLNAAGLAKVGHSPTDFTDVNDAAHLAAIPKFPNGQTPPFSGPFVDKLIGVDQQPNGTFLGFLPNNTFFGTPPTGTNGLAPVNQYIFNTSKVRSNPRFGAILPGFNVSAFGGAFPEQDRWGGYTAFNGKICNDQLQLYGDFYYADVKSHDELAPPATGPFELPGQFAIFIPPHAAFTNDTPGARGGPPNNTPTAAEVGAPPGAFNPFNPFGQFISGGSEARIADFGNRLFDNENEAWLSTIGIKGDKLFDGSWGYDGAFRYSQILNISQTRDVDGPRFERILNANDSLFDPSSTDFIGQTIPYNPFNDFRVPIATNIPLVNYATLHRRDLLTSKLATLDLNIYTTDLFDLPGGPVGLALGGFFSRETYEINPDDQGNIIHPEELGIGGVQPVKAGRKEVAFYGEIRVPIFSPKMGIPGLHSLEVEAGARFEEFRNNDTNVLVPKVALRWQPFDEQLTIRSTWGEGFLEPSMTELYGPTVSGIGPSIFTPTGEINPETTVEGLPNKNLAPEHDRTWTGGFVYTPKWIPRGSLTFTVDFWDIERTGLVGAIPPQVIIDEFVAQGGMGLGSVKIITGTQQPKPGESAVLIDPEGNFAGVASPLLNGGKQDARGVDLELQYQIQTFVGTFTSLTRATYLEDFVFAFPGSKQAFHVAGRSNSDFIEGMFFGSLGGGDGWMRWRGIENLDWTWKNWDLNWTVHYIGGFREEIRNKKIEGVDILHYVKATWFTDASLSYNFSFSPPAESQPVAGYSKGGREVVTNKEGKAIETSAAYSMPCWKTILNNTTFTVGVNNIFGEDPPHAIGPESDNFLNKYPAFLYDNLGRFVYVRLIKKF